MTLNDECPLTPLPPTLRITFAVAAATDAICLVVISFGVSSNIHENRLVCNQEVLDLVGILLNSILVSPTLN